MSGRRRAARRSNQWTSRSSADRPAARKAARRSPARRCTSTTCRRPGMLHGVTVRSPVARGRITDIRFDPGDPLGRVHHRHRRRHSRRRTRRADPRRSAVPRRRRRQSPEEPVVLLAHPDRARADEARRHVDDRHRAAAGGAHDRRLARGPRDHLGRRQHLQELPGAKGDVDAAFAGAPRSSSRASTRPARRSSSTSSRNGMIAVADADARRHGVGLDAVPVLHPQGARGAVRPAAGAHPRRADGDRRRVRRQGGVSRR